MVGERKYVFPSTNLCQQAGLNTRLNKAALGGEGEERGEGVKREY